MGRPGGTTALRGNDKGDAGEDRTVAGWRAGRGVAVGAVRPDPPAQPGQAADRGAVPGVRRVPPAPAAAVVRRGRARARGGGRGGGHVCRRGRWAGRGVHADRQRGTRTERCGTGEAAGGDADPGRPARRGPGAGRGERRPGGPPRGGYGGPGRAGRPGGPAELPVPRTGAAPAVAPADPEQLAVAKSYTLGDPTAGAAIDRQYRCAAVTGGVF